MISFIGGNPQLEAQTTVEITVVTCNHHDDCPFSFGLVFDLLTCNHISLLRSRGR